MLYILRCQLFEMRELAAFLSFILLDKTKKKGLLDYVLNRHIP